VAVGVGIARARTGARADLALTTVALAGAFAIPVAGAVAAAAAGRSAAALHLRSGRCAVPTNSTTTAAITAISAGPASSARMVCPSVAPPVTITGALTLDTQDRPDTLDTLTGGGG